MTRRLNVLMIAPNCDATDVGEAWSTHQWVAGMAQRHEVTLLSYRKRDRPDAGPQLPHVEVVQWKDWPIVGRFERFNSMLKPGYLGFYRKARRWISQALGGGRTFDLIHQVSPLAIRYPSPGVGWGIPLIVGPLAGSLDAPGGFALSGASGGWYTRLRALDAWRFAHDPWLRRTLSEASAVVAVAPYVRDLLHAVPIQRFAYCSETGVVALRDPVATRPIEPGTLKLLYVGRIIRTKGLRDAIEALSRLPQRQGITFDVLGEGPDRLACQALVRERQLEACVRFHGRVPREQVDAFYARSDVFVFPSFREPSGNVVFEALGHGLPVVTSDQGGPAYVVDDTCGVCCPAKNPDQYAQVLAQAIGALQADPDQVARLSQGARARVETIGLWPHKIQFMDALYRQVLDEANPLADTISASSPTGAPIPETGATRAR